MEWEITFSCSVYVGCCPFLCIEDFCVRDSMYDESVGVFPRYISVGFGILMEVGDVELGMSCLYFLFTYLYGIQMY